MTLSDLRALMHIGMGSLALALSALQITDHFGDLQFDSHLRQLQCSFAQYFAGGNRVECFGLLVGDEVWGFLIVANIERSH